MEIYNLYGQRVATRAIISDIDAQMTFEQIKEKRALKYETIEEFLLILEEVTKKNPANFRQYKKKLLDSEKRGDLKKRSEKKQKAVQKQVQQAEKKQKENEMAQNIKKVEVNELKSAEDRRTSLLDEIATAEKKFSKAQDLFNLSDETFSETRKLFAEIERKLENAEKDRKQKNWALKESEKRVGYLKKKLEEVEEKIESLRKQKIYLVAPGYYGVLPEYGTFISTVSVEKIPEIQIEQPTELEIEPEFKEMLKSGFDSAQEYMRAITFVSLCEQYGYGDGDFEVLVSDDRIKLLLKNHLGGDF